MVWSAKDGAAHLFETAENGQRALCNRATLGNETVWKGVSPKTPPCIYCARLLARLPNVPAPSDTVVP